MSSLRCWAFAWLNDCANGDEADFTYVQTQKTQSLYYLGLGRLKLKAAHPVNYFHGFWGKNIKNCPPSKLFLFTSLITLVLGTPLRIFQTLFISTMHGYEYDKPMAAYIWGLLKNRLEIVWIVTRRIIPGTSGGLEIVIEIVLWIFIKFSLFLNWKVHLNILGILIK